jgi:hypothetical protein
LVNLIVIGVALTGIASPLVVGSRLLSSVGKPHLTAWTQLGQSCLHASLFIACWRQWGLTAAVVSVGVSAVAGNLVLTVLGHHYMPARLSVLRESASCAIACSLTAALSLMLAPEFKPLALLATLPLFAVLAGYSVPECRRILHCFLPARFACNQ